MGCPQRYKPTEVDVSLYVTRSPSVVNATVYAPAAVASTADTLEAGAAATPRSSVLGSSGMLSHDVTSLNGYGGVNVVIEDATAAPKSDRTHKDGSAQQEAVRVEAVDDSVTERNGENGVSEHALHVGTEARGSSDVMRSPEAAQKRD